MAHWRAFCDKCNKCVKEADGLGWLNNFFLPDRCPNCHDFKSSWQIDGWIKQYGEMVRVTPFVWNMPSTWFSKYVWKEIK